MPREFELVGIAPWGRSAGEYEAFFALGDLPSGSRVLDCGGGPASFSAEWGARGHFTVAADPLYERSPTWIASEFETVVPRMRQGMERARDRFRWDVYTDAEGVIGMRRAALETFLEDIGSDARWAHYLAARLPDLPFRDSSFDVVLCSHLLFLYSEVIDADAHVACLREMLRVGDEVRVFPLLDMDGRRSEHLDWVIGRVRSFARSELVGVPFEFQRGANEMLRLRRL